MAGDEITYTADLAAVDWAALKAALRADSFDNGRSPAEYAQSFHASRLVCLAYAGLQVVGTARALSDGVCNAYIVDVWTSSAYRRRGIASAMLRALLAQLDGQHVALFADSAPELYERLGFRAEPGGMGVVAGAWLRRRA